MKMAISKPEHPTNHKKRKMVSSSVEAPAPTPAMAIADVLLDENLLYEIMKHVDAQTLGSASCVNKEWNVTAQDERLWEMICTQHWTNNQLRSVVLALGGFKRLYTHYLWPLSKPPTSKAAASSSSSSIVAAAWPCLQPQRTNCVTKPKASVTRWGKDEVQLSLSLLSIRYYEKMKFNNLSK